MKMNGSNTARTGRLIIQASVLAAAAVWITGCDTVGYKKGDVVASNSEVAAAEVQTESRDLDATTKALNELVNQPATDAKPQFQQFSKALEQLVASANRAGGISSRMLRKRNEYFHAWDQEITTINDETIRKSSQDRKDAASVQFDNASHQFDEVQKNLQVLIGYLQDIRKALSTDLTRQGLTSIQPSVNSANEKARNLQTVLQQSAASLNAVSIQMSSFRVRGTQ